MDTGVREQDARVRAPVRIVRKASIQVAGQPRQAHLAWPDATRCLVLASVPGLGYAPDDVGASAVKAAGRVLGGPGGPGLVAAVLHTAVGQVPGAL